MISRNILWTVGALCGIFVISCATIPSRPLPEKDPFDVLLNSLLALPPGGQFYMGARIADAAGLRTEIERTLPANESIRQGLKVTEQDKHGPVCSRGGAKCMGCPVRRALPRLANQLVPLVASCMEKTPFCGRNPLLV
ncbi:MAG: hypothetical protein N2509_03560 [Treponemataceae bacterium]|nr:hypothetical protein [Treponemataceae bacterium]